MVAPSFSAVSQNRLASVTLFPLARGLPRTQTTFIFSPLESEELATESTEIAEIAEIIVSRFFRKILSLLSE